MISRKLTWSIKCSALKCWRATPFQHHSPKQKHVIVFVWMFHGDYQKLTAILSCLRQNKMVNICYSGPLCIKLIPEKVSSLKKSITSQMLQWTIYNSYSKKKISPVLSAWSWIIDHLHDQLNPFGHLNLYNGK